MKEPRKKKNIISKTPNKNQKIIDNQIKSLYLELIKLLQKYIVR